MDKIKMKKRFFAVLLSAMILYTSYAAGQSTQATSTQPKPATKFTIEANAKVLTELPFDDRDDYASAKRGLIALLPNNGVVMMPGSDTKKVWNLPAYNFIKNIAPQKAPSTVNPSLWRIAQLNLHNGLFEVVKNHIYQIRGQDLSNMTIIEGTTGIIVVDPLVTLEAAQAGMNLYYDNRGKKPVVAVIYTHSHTDHYGGVKGVISEQDVTSHKVKIYAPNGFLEEAVSENVYAGNAMSRRAQYQYGSILAPGEQGQVDAGLGKTTSYGTPTLIAPLEIDLIRGSGEKRTIDGVKFVFMMAPNTEAPAEMLFYLPDWNALCAAEVLTHTLHNLYTLRGAQVRDAVAWWKTINQVIESFGDNTDVVFAQHHWPMWGQSKILQYMKNQRDQFKYIHDQTLRLANHGYTSIEIAEMIQLPKSLSMNWYNRGYYGSVSHDSKAVYQRYLGWYDSNPANLNPLTPTEAGKKYVEFMGGADEVIKKAQIEFDNGGYRFVAQVLNNLVFADPTNQVARNLEADALEQLGYQQENPTWRNEYLQGAYELRKPYVRNPPPTGGSGTASPDVLDAMPGDMLLDYIGIRLNGPNAATTSTSTFNFQFTGNSNDNYAATLENGVLVYTEKKQFDHADVTVAATVPVFVQILSGTTTVQQQIDAGNIKIRSGNSAKLVNLFNLLDSFNVMFNIIDP